MFRAYPHIGKVLPAVGYGSAQLAALAATVNASAAEVVVSATPIDLARLRDRQEDRARPLRICRNSRETCTLGKRAGR